MTEKFNDDDLKAFLQKNKLVAPPAPRGQLEQLLARLGLENKNKKVAPMFAWGGLVAAGFAAVFIFFGTQKTLQQASPETVAYETETEEDYFEEELPSLEVGGDYFDLVASVDE
jgi:hypothetical protein